MDEIVVIGGPNSAGNTTAAQLFGPAGVEIRQFANAVENVERAPFGPEDAALVARRIMLERMNTRAHHI